MASTSQRRRKRYFVVVLITLLLLTIGSLTAPFWVRNKTVPPQETTTAAPTVRYYIPPWTAAPTLVEIRYALTPKSRPTTATAHYLDARTGSLRVPKVHRFSTTLESVADGDRSARLTTSNVTDSGVLWPTVTSSYPNMRSADSPSFAHSFCHVKNSPDARAVCDSGRLSSLRNGVLLFMAPSACDSEITTNIITLYQAFLSARNGDTPSTRFVAPLFEVSESDEQTLRFLFHTLPALNRNALFFHPYPVHVFCRGRPTDVYLTTLRSSLTNAAYITMEDVSGVLTETVTQAATTYARSVFQDKLLASLKARVTALQKQVEVPLTTVTSPAPEQGGTAGDVEQFAGAPVDDVVQVYLQNTVRQWIEEWEYRRFWAYQVWFLPSLANYDVFWRLDAARSVLTKPLDEDVFSDLMDHGCAFGFHGVRYSTQEFSRGVSGIVDAWNGTLLKSFSTSVSSQALRASWTWLTDSRVTFHGKHFAQDFFVGAFSTFRRPLMKAFWQTVESPVHFDANKMRWDDGIPQTIIAETTAEAESWNVCHFASIPGYRLS